MSTMPSSPTRRDVLATSAAASAASLLPTQFAAVAESNAIRPFRINIPDENLVDLRRRIATTRWPERENVNDFSQGVQLAKIQPLARYWGTDYDWRKAEAKLNALPQFVTTIDRPQTLGYSLADSPVGMLAFYYDRPPVTLKAGQVLFIPYATPHTVKNVGSGNAAELATYIVEKGKPLVVLGKLAA